MAINSNSFQEHADAIRDKADEYGISLQYVKAFWLSDDTPPHLFSDTDLHLIFDSKVGRDVRRQFTDALSDTLSCSVNAYIGEDSFTAQFPDEQAQDLEALVGYKPSIGFGR